MQERVRWHNFGRCEVLEVCTPPRGDGFTLKISCTQVVIQQQTVRTYLLR